MPKYDSKQVAGLEVGDVLAGKYRVEQVLGVGGMGVVIAAHHLQLDEKVAIKFLLPQMLDDAAAVNRFIREARAAVKIKSEHVARVFDVGTLENGAPYMVMEFLEGGDLARRLLQRGPMAIEQTVEFVLQACVAVAEAHRLGIVHRDLKPANLFCVRRADGQLAVKVLDFGISKVPRIAGALTDPNEITASLMGSPFYMSPEQMQGAGDIDARTDIWALGVILYELLTGGVPFPGTSITEVAVMVSSKTPAPIRQHRPDVPAALEAVVARCLEKDRRSRFADVSELASALEPFGSRRAAAYVERIAGTLDPRLRSTFEPTLDATVDARAAEAETAAPGTIAPMGRTVPRGISATPGLIAASLVVLGAFGAAGAIWARATHQTIHVTTDSGGVSQPPPHESAATSEAPSGWLPVATAPSEPVPTSATLEPIASVMAGAPPPGPKPRAATRHAPPPVASGGEKDCRVVSFFDSDGNQHFKTACGHDGH